MLRNLMGASAIMIAIWGAGLGALEHGGAAMAQTGYRGKVLTESGFQEFIAGYKKELVTSGISADLVERAFSGVTLDLRIIKYDQNQPEFSKPIWAYLDTAVSEKRVSAGLAARARVEPVLQAVEARYGVPAAIMASIWGVESYFGKIRGDFDVVRSLATLIYNERRARFWRAQMREALRIMEQGHAGSARLKGSWASAMGHTQLIPEAFMRHAVDFNNDGRKDIWTDDPTDGLASTARYLRNFDWREGQPPFLHVTLPEGFDFSSHVERTRTTVEWSALNVTMHDGAALPWGLRDAKLYLPAGARGPALLTLANFRVIKRYNPSNSYAFAVSLLAERLDGKPPRQFSWPRDDRPLSRTERYELQERLTALGFDTKGVDGILGRNTRKAVRAFQAARKMTADGYPSALLLAAVRAASPNHEVVKKPPSAAASLAPVDPPKAPAPLSIDEIKEMQALLNRLGFDVGEPDGVPGAKTSAGIRAAVKRHRLSMAPEPSRELLTALRVLAKR